MPAPDPTLNARGQRAIFVVSSGRTGTQFLGDKMRRMIADCHSIHEADVFWITRPGEWLRKIRQFGWYRMTLGKLSPRYSLRALGLARITGRFDAQRAGEAIADIRGPYMAQVAKPVFLEANGQYILLLDLLSRAFPNSRVIYIVRDPRDWVRSWMNMENPFYSVRDLRSWLLGGRLKPKHFSDDPWRKRWRGMDQFEKLCWLWQKENGLALELAEGRPEIRTFRFEALFAGSERDPVFRQLLAFVTAFPDGYQAHWDFRPELLDQKVHSRSQGGFAAWRDWDRDTELRLQRICGPLMARLGYGTEPEWRALLGEPPIEGPSGAIS